MGNEQIYSVMDVVEEKLDIFYNEDAAKNCNLNKAEMLSLILYSNGKCMKDLSESQLTGNYLKWKWFDRSLFDAIEKLSKCQYASYPIYCYTDSIKVDKLNKNGYFKTYLECHRYKEVALSLMEETDVLIEINKSFTSKTNKCCDISWISSFPDEYQVILQRNTSNKNKHGFKYKCFREKGNNQR